MTECLKLYHLHHFTLLAQQHFVNLYQIVPLCSSDGMLMYKLTVWWLENASLQNITEYSEEITNRNNLHSYLPINTVMWKNLVVLLNQLGDFQWTSVLVFGSAMNIHLIYKLNFHIYVGELCVLDHMRLYIMNLLSCWLYWDETRHLSCSLGATLCSLVDIFCTFRTHMHHPADFRWVERGEGNDPSLPVNSKQPNDTWQYKMENSNKHQCACLEALLVQ